MNSLRHQARNPGKKATATPPIHLSCPEHLEGDDLPLHARSHKSSSVLSTCRGRTRTSGPPQTAGLIYCRLASICWTGDEGALFVFIWIMIKWKPLGAGQQNAFRILSRPQQPGFSLCLHTVYLDENTESFLFPYNAFSVTSNHD